MAEKTGPQVIVKRRYEGSGKYGPIDPRKIRDMRRDSVISLIRTMLFAGVLSGEWSVETTEPDDNNMLDQVVLDEIKNFVKDQMENVRLHLLRTAVNGCFDFGWQGYEKVFELDTERLLFTLKKLKPLLQDLTTIVSDEADGSFNGFKNGEVKLMLEECLLLNFDVEGTMWEGQSQIELAEEYFDEKKISRMSATRYDKKMSGSQWVVKYPVGTTPIPGTDESKPNHLIADDILDAIEGSGMIAIPQARSPLTTAENKGQNAWEIELIDASGAVVQFTERFNYHDKCIARVLGWPERSILEGQFGTKAEAEAHGDFVVTMIEYRHDGLVEQINWHLVNQLIRVNWGEQYENAAWLKAAKLNDNAKTFLRDLYWKILENPDGFMIEFDHLDIDSIAQSLGVPRREDTTNVGNELPQNLPTDPAAADGPSATDAGAPATVPMG